MMKTIVGILSVLVLVGCSPSDRGKDCCVVEDTKEARGNTYVGKEGDTLAHIAFTELGDQREWPKIFDLNRDKFESVQDLRVGMVLKLPPA